MISVSNNAVHLIALPYDIFLDLFTFLDPVDIFSLLRTSKLIYPYALDERIWRMLASRYGVKSIAIFQPRYTWYEVYTGLLHRYGGLLGLWASDYPYRGNILECRINEDGKWHGLIGEVWKFASANDQADTRNPWLPSYVESFSIPLMIRLPSNGSGGSSRRTCYSELRWYPEPRGPFGILGARRRSTPSLLLLSSTNQATFIHVPSPGPSSQRSRIPNFPSENASWYDRDRDLPRLPQVPPYESREPNDIFTGRVLERDSYLYLDRTDYNFPAALSFDIPDECREQRLLHKPYMPHFLQDLRIVHHPEYRGVLVPITDRYYPLRGPKPIDKGSPGGWDPSNLIGLWLGVYGLHGTEVLYIDWEPQLNEVRAWKVTGDYNVPRGVTTWRFNVRPGGEPQLDVPASSFRDLKPIASFAGTGTISAIGFLYVLCINYEEEYCCYYNSFP